MSETPRPRFTLPPRRRWAQAKSLAGTGALSVVLVGSALRRAAAAPPMPSERPADPPIPSAAPGRFAAPPPDELPAAAPSPVEAPRAIGPAGPIDNQSVPVAYRPRRRGHFPQGWLMPIGLNLGGVVRSRVEDAGFLVGAEASVVKLPAYRALWAGAYIDALYDGQVDQGRFSIGPELGVGPFGVDAGLYGAHGKQGNAWGAVVRAFLSLGFILPYVRGGFPLDAGTTQPRFLEIGALIKLPLTLVAEE